MGRREAASTARRGDDPAVTHQVRMLRGIAKLRSFLGARDRRAEHAGSWTRWNDMNTPRSRYCTPGFLLRDVARWLAELSSGAVCVPWFGVCISFPCAGPEFLSRPPSRAFCRQLSARAFRVRITPETGVISTVPTGRGPRHIETPVRGHARSGGVFRVHRSAEFIRPRRTISRAPPPRGRARSSRWAHASVPFHPTADRRRPPSRLLFVAGRPWGRRLRSVISEKLAG